MQKKTHTLRPEELTVNLSRMSLATVHDLEWVLPPDLCQSIRRQFHTLFEDAHALLRRLDGYEQKVGIELSEEEIYTLYVTLDMMGRIFTSDYRAVFFGHIVKGKELSDPVAQQFIVQTALPNIDNFFKLTNQYAAQTNSLERLPDIKRRLGLLPMFD